MRQTRRTTLAILAGGAGTVALGLPAFARASPVKIAVIGEQIVHSLHRENDPEFPQLLGETLDGDFRIDPMPHPTGGGMLYGGGSKYRIGNFGHPRGTVIHHALENPKAILRSEELKLAEAFSPNIVGWVHSGTTSR